MTEEQRSRPRETSSTLTAHRAIFAILVVTAAGCTSKPTTPFDPTTDPRIGEEVAAACVRADGDPRDGLVRLGDETGYVFGRGRERYVALFSRGCRDLSQSGAAPVFRTTGPACRRRGDQVTTSRGGGAIGLCQIDRIFRWSRDGGAETAIDDIAGDR